MQKKTERGQKQNKSENQSVYGVTTICLTRWYATPVRWMDYLSKGGVLTNTDLDRFVNNIWEK